MEAPMRGITTSTPRISTPRYIIRGWPLARIMLHRSVSSTSGRCPRSLMASTNRRVEYKERLRERRTTVFFARRRAGRAGGTGGAAGAAGCAGARAFFDFALRGGMEGGGAYHDSQQPGGSDASVCYLPRE